MVNVQLANVQMANSMRVEFELFKSVQISNSKRAELAHS